MASDQAGRSHNPGAGGWPTIKYFNKKTGYEGAPYVMKTKKSVCDELGDNGNMEAYVMEAADTYICNISTKVGCGQKEVDYSVEWLTKPVAEVGAERQRLDRINTSKLNANSAAWIRQRKGVLKQIMTSAPPAAVAPDL